MTHIMIALETLGTRLTSVIVQVAAVAFNLEGEIRNRIVLNIHPQLSMDAGFTVDWATIEWWMNQSSEAKKTVFADKIHPLHHPSTAIQKFNAFIEDNNGSDALLWSHKDFDFSRLEYHMSHLCLKPAFSYRSAMDIRTLLKIAGIEKKDLSEDASLVKHSAIDDCLYQVGTVLKAYGEINKKGRLRSGLQFHTKVKA